MSQYIKKGDIGTQSGGDVDFDEILIDFFNEYRRIKSSKHFVELLNYFLKLCKIGDVKLKKQTILRALNKCKNAKCVSMLNEYSKTNDI